ncbi:MAG: hypothetical protein EXR45_06015 [Chloroflexi bacterium]|nr:hypothetical protein [Chloroflexota bacterium]
MGVFLFVPVLGRFTMALVLRGYPYAREVGAGNAFKTGARWWHIVVAGTIATSVAVPFGTMVVATGVLGGVLAWFLGRWITSRLGGLTGDTYGFICEVVETFAFVALSATPLV